MDKELYERLAKIEAVVDELKSDIKDLQGKLNGYLDHKIQQTIQAWIGKIVLSAIVSSGGLTALLVWLLRR